MATDGTLCRALFTHALEISGGIEVVKGGQRILFYCPRCDSYRTDIWDARGRRVKPPKYQRSKEYNAFIKSTDRYDARMLILAHTKEVTSGSGESAQVRSLQGGKVRSRNRQSAQRARKRRRRIA